MAPGVNLVFTGDDIDEINEKILDYVADLKEKTEASSPLPKKTGKKKKSKAKKPVPEVDEDLLPEGDDDFGEDDNAETENNENGFGDIDDLLPEEDTKSAGASLEDVRDVLGTLSKMGHEETAQKVLKKFGKCEALTDLDKSKYQAVFDATEKIIAKLESA